MEKDLKDFLILMGVTLGGTLMAGILILLPRWQPETSGWVVLAGLVLLFVMTTIRWVFVYDGGPYQRPDDRDDAATRRLIAELERRNGR